MRVEFERLRPACPAHIVCKIGGLFYGEVTHFEGGWRVYLANVTYWPKSQIVYWGGFENLAKAFHFIKRMAELSAFVEKQSQREGRRAFEKMRQEQMAIFESQQKKPDRAYVHAKERGPISPKIQAVLDKLYQAHSQKKQASPGLMEMAF